MKFEQLKENKVSRYILGVILGLAILSLIISIWLEVQQSFRIVFGSVYVLFLPGLVMTFVFFPIKNQGEKEIDVLERIALSFALSIAVVSLLVFYLNLVGMKINVLSVSLVIAFIILMGLILIHFQTKKNKKSEFPI